MTNAEFSGLMEEIAEIAVLLVGQADGQIEKINKGLWEQLCRKVDVARDYN